MAQRRVAALGVMMLASLALVGCSPGIIGIAGLHRVGDDLRAVVVTCPDHDLDVLTLRDRSQTNDRSEYAVVEEWELQDDEDRVLSAEIGSLAEFVERVDTGSDFMLHGDSASPWPVVVLGPVFSATAVDELQDGKILTRTYPEGTPTVLGGEQEFVDLVDDQLCKEE